MQEEIIFFVYDFRKKYPPNVIRRLFPHKECAMEISKPKQVNDGKRYTIVIFQCFNCRRKNCFFKRATKEQMKRFQITVSRSMRWFDDKNEEE